MSENKERILKYEFDDSDRRLNSMGCLESWYDSDFAINKTFSKEELKDMSDKEIDNLVRLANNIADGLY